MGIITHKITVPDLYNYEPEYNADGTEKHIVLHGARFHVVSWDSNGQSCSEPNCEINRKLTR